MPTAPTIDQWRRRQPLVRVPCANRKYLWFQRISLRLSRILGWLSITSSAVRILSAKSVISSVPTVVLGRSVVRHARPEPASAKAGSSAAVSRRPRATGSLGTGPSCATNDLVGDRAESFAHVRDADDHGRSTDR